MTDLDLFLIPQGALPWQSIKIEKLAFHADQSTLSRCHWGNGLPYFNFKWLNRMDFSTLCTMLVTFGPETPELTLLTIDLLRRYGKNWHITSNISMSWILTYFTGLVGILMRMIIPIFIWQSLKGRCYGNQLNLEDVRRHCHERPLLFALLFDNA